MSETTARRVLAGRPGAAEMPVPGRRGQEGGRRPAVAKGRAGCRDTGVSGRSRACRDTPGNVL
ncbi:hypothetical protein GCM10023334_035920 [Nonomuraea thailandensis]